MSTKSTSPAQQADFVKETLSLLRDSYTKGCLERPSVLETAQRSCPVVHIQKTDRTATTANPSNQENLEKMLSSKKTVPIKFVPKPKMVPMLIDPLPLKPISNKKPTGFIKENITNKARFEKQLQERRQRDQEKAKAAQAIAESNMSAIQKAREDRKRRLQLELSGQVERPVEQNKPKKVCRRLY